MERGWRGFEKVGRIVVEFGVWEFFREGCVRGGWVRNMGLLEEVFKFILCV